jgi:hypothetical protein
MNSPFWSHHFPAFGLGLALLASAGCGAESGAVTGTVSFQGKSVASGTVIIVGADSLPYYGAIQDDGTYTIARVPTGLAKIAVLSPGPDSGPNIRMAYAASQRGFEKKVAPRAFRGDPHKWFPLPEKCAEFDTSGLTLTVTRGTNELDIVLH